MKVSHVILSRTAYFYFRFGNMIRNKQIGCQKSITFKIYEQCFEHMKKLNLCRFEHWSVNKFITPIPSVIKC